MTPPKRGLTYEGPSTWEWPSAWATTCEGLTWERPYLRRALYLSLYLRRALCSSPHLSWALWLRCGVVGRGRKSRCGRKRSGRWRPRKSARATPVAAWCSSWPAAAAYRGLTRRAEQPGPRRTSRGTSTRGYWAGCAAGRCGPSKPRSWSDRYGRPRCMPGAWARVVQMGNSADWGGESDVGQVVLADRGGALARGLRRRGRAPTRGLRRVQGPEIASCSIIAHFFQR